MKRKALVVGLLLVAVSASVFVVQGISQPPDRPSPTILQTTDLSASSPTTSTPPSATWGYPPSKAPTVTPPSREWTFEQLVEALKGVRARQKELKTQEADLLAKMADKVEQKRNDLNKAEETLHQLRGEPSPRQTTSSSGNFTSPAPPK